MNVVLGVEDAGDVARAMRKRRVQRPWLVLRPAGIDDHLHQMGVAVGDGLGVSRVPWSSLPTTTSTSKAG